MNRMESSTSNAEYEGEKAENLRDAILHPLASITVEPQEWMNPLQLRPVSQSFIEAGSFQSICLDESVYFSESTAFSSSNKCVLHKCDMKKQSYYKFPTKVEGYALAVYHSKVVLIGGDVPSSRRQGRDVTLNNDLKYPVFVKDDPDLEERLRSALDRVPQESRYVYDVGRNACAVGEGDLLIVIGGDGPGNTKNDTLQLQSNNQEYVRVFDGQNWSYGVITNDSVNIRSMRKTLVVFQNHIYMTACGDKYPRIKFYHISLECFRNRLDPNALLSWNQLEDVPDRPPCTNLSVLGNQLVTVGVVDGEFRMYAYLASSSMWSGAHVHEFQTSDVKSVSCITGIIGLQSSSSLDHVEALLVGADVNHTKIFKLTTKSQPYNPDGSVEFLALLKLECLANIPVLTDIEKNAEQFMGTAGFKLEQFRRRVQLAYEYIESWKMEKNPCYKPTWSGFFAVLRQIGLDPLATSIDGILKEISPPHEPLDECKDPENAIQLLVKLKDMLTELSKPKSEYLKEGVVACANKCDEVLQKLKMEMADTERELESRNASIEILTSELTNLKYYIQGIGQPPAKYRCIDESDKRDDSPAPKLKDLLKELCKKVADKWENIGVMLEIEEGQLNKVKSDNAGNSDNCLREMLKIWLKKVDPKPSWSSMADALQDLGEESLAEHIRKSY